jgi:hypothetical protein
LNTRRNFIKKSILGSVYLATGGVFAGYNAKNHRGSENKRRIIIETDAGGDPDDEQSLVRFLLYANEFEILGIIANRQVARERENKNLVRDGLGIVKAMINAYGRCHSNLIQHDDRYPKEEDLLKVAVAGYDDTDDGVNLIIRAVDARDRRPIWFCNWGTDNGSAESCVKRALDKIMVERGPKGYAAFKRKLRLSSCDKFGEHTTTLEPPFPLWVDTWAPEMGGKRWYHRFSALTAKAGGFDIERDVRTSHGPLGALYPLNTNIPQKEGDTMCFLYLLPTGMNDPDQPGWGSWGGRSGLNENFPGKPYYWANQSDTWRGTTNRDNTLARWAEALQNDFRARMDWCVKKRNEANHHPIAILNGKSGSEILQIDAVAGETIKLDAKGSVDPDNNGLSASWCIYNEAGTYTGEIYLNSTNELSTSFVAPDVKKPETIHVILQIRNNGKPSLYAFRRAIITVKSL